MPAKTPASLIDHTQNAPTGSGASAHDELGRSFWIGLIVGGAVMAFGLRGALAKFDSFSERFVYTKYLIGFDLLHDLVIAPITFVLCYLLHRVISPRFKAPLTFGLFTSAMIIALAWYPLHHTTQSKGNPTFQPLNYTTAVSTALAVVWALAAIWALVASRPQTKPRRL